MYVIYTYEIPLKAEMATVHCYNEIKNFMSQVISRHDFTDHSRSFLANYMELICHCFFQGFGWLV